MNPLSNIPVTQFATRALLSKEQLQLIDPLAKEKAVDLFLPYLNKYMPLYGINTPQRIAAFLGQILHESGHFKYVREIWGPTTQQKKYERDFNSYWPIKAADKPLVPADRNYLSHMLGNAYEGDGALFKGHGLIQITGRRNHGVCSTQIFGDDRLIKEPELLTVPEYAVQSACWFIQWRKLHGKLDTPGVEDETKVINGGANGLKERKAIYSNAIKLLKTK